MPTCLGCCMYCSLCQACVAEQQHLHRRSKHGGQTQTSTLDSLKPGCTCGNMSSGCALGPLLAGWLVAGWPLPPALTAASPPPPPWLCPSAPADESQRDNGTATE
jgi:hypothetical protein